MKGVYIYDCAITVRSQLFLVHSPGPPQQHVSLPAGQHNGRLNFDPHVLGDHACSSRHVPLEGRAAPSLTCEQRHQ